MFVCGVVPVPPLGASGGGTELWGAPGGPVPPRDRGVWVGGGLGVNGSPHPCGDSRTIRPRWCAQRTHACTVSILSACSGNNPTAGITQQPRGKLQGTVFCCLLLLSLFIRSKRTPPPLFDLRKGQHGIALPGLADTTTHVLLVRFGLFSPGCGLAFAVKRARAFPLGSGYRGQTRSGPC